MLRLPSFQHHLPSSLEEAAVLLQKLLTQGHEVKLIAGGTDLVPNMKHEILTPAHVVSLKHAGLSGIERQGNTLRLGAMTSIHALAHEPLVSEHLPALAQAAAVIAGPQLRRMGTLGGNICLDTRCLYINQTYFWRQSLGFCLKKDGSVCHVVAGGQRCVAAASNDSVLPLMLYNAEVHLLHATAGGTEERRVPLTEFFVANGVKNTIIEPHEILTHVTVPVPAPTRAVAFEKLRIRKDIDYPLLNLAVRVDREAPEASSPLTGCEVVVSALGARPKQISLDKQVKGKRLDAELADTIARKVHGACRPLTNIATEPSWRRAMVPVLTKRALARV